MQWTDAAATESFVRDETTGVELGDERLAARLVTIFAAAAEAPSSSFPRMSGSDAALEGTYRFLNNKKVTAEGVLAPHFRATAQRVHATERVVIAHDTTEFSFGPVARGDLQPVGHGKSYGFDAHVALAVTGDESRIPLGVLAVKTFNRTFGSARLPGGKNKDKPDNTMHRWAENVRLVRQRLGDAAHVVHVFDREADDYALLAEMVELGARFVVRQDTDRRLIRHRKDSKTRALIAQTPLVTEREVVISARRKPTRKTHASRTPVRKARKVQLEIRATTMVLPRTVGAGGRGPETLTLNLVEALERNPPAGQPPIAWWLWTNEPIDTPEQILEVIDTYRTRWVVEEYFKALKSGCRFEDRQLESQHALFNALAIFVPVAWRLLLLRSLSRQAPGGPAALALTDLQQRALRGYMKKKRNVELPLNLTLRDAMYAVAQLGGHITNNGAPGWMVLARGMDRVLDIELGIALALDRSDQ